METSVVCILNSRYDVYIRRLASSPDAHFGNPFSCLPVSSWAYTKVASQEEEISAYREWLHGVGYQEVEPQRRKWILGNLHTLRGKRLGCFCHLQACHGDVLVELLNELDQRLSSKEEEE